VQRGPAFSRKVEMAHYQNRFKVFGSEPGWIVRIEVKDVSEALWIAEGMIKDRFQEIYILDRDGKVHRPTSFQLLLANNQAGGAGRVV
jgi:hypothetical protein